MIKSLTCNADSLQAKMFISQSDDIRFCIYDYQMNLVKIDTIIGNCMLVFPPEINVELQLYQINKFSFKCTLIDFKGYRKFNRCMLNIAVNKKRHQFLFKNY